MNGDGIPDVVVGNQCATPDHTNGLIQNEPGAVSVLLGNGDGTVPPAVLYGSAGYCGYSVALGDLRGDGKVDIAMAKAA